MEEVIKEIMGLVAAYGDACETFGDYQVAANAQECVNAKAAIESRLRQALQCKGCAVQQGTHVPAEAVVQIQEPSRIKPSMSMHATREDYELALAEWKANPKNGYFDGDDDDEDGTPVFQSAEEVIRRSAEVRELRAGDVICIVQLVNDEYANEQHARLTSIDDPDAETVLAWEFITAEEAKEAKAPLAAVQQGVQPEGRTDAEIVERTEAAARFLLEWKYGLTPEADGAQLRHSKNAKAQWAWEAACKVQEIITDSDAFNAAQEVDDETATQQGLDAQGDESDYQRGYRHGYNRRDAEVQGALL